MGELTKEQRNIQAKIIDIAIQKLQPIEEIKKRSNPNFKMLRCVTTFYNDVTYEVVFRLFRNWHIYDWDYEFVELKEIFRLRYTNN